MSLPRIDSSSAFTSLLGYTASDSESDEEKNAEGEKMTVEETKEVKEVKPQPQKFPKRLVSYDGEDAALDDSTEMDAVDAELEGIKEDENEDANDRKFDYKLTLVNSGYLDHSLGSSFAESIKNKKSDEVTLPPEPKGRCSKHLQDKIIKCYRKYDNMNPKIQNNKEFRNPSIYEKLISYLSIDQLGTNYPKEMYDPHIWEESSYYEALSKAQREDMAKREKEKKERTKVEFVTGMAKKPLPIDQQLKQVTASTLSSSSAAASTAQILGEEPERKRKSKWGMQTNPHLAVAAGTLPIVVNRPQVTIITTTVTHPVVISTTTSAAGSKTTVISSVGTLKKPKLDPK